MATYFWNGPVTRINIPTAGGTVNSDSFYVPDGAKTMQIHVPALQGADTLKLQALKPIVGVEQLTEIWSDVSTMNLSDGSFVALDAIPASAVTTIPVSATGGGNLRFVSTATEAAATVVIVIYYALD